MFNNSALSAADVAAVTDGNRNSGWGGDGGWWVLIILFALFGWGGNRGFGNGGYGVGGGTFDGGIPNGFALATDVHNVHASMKFCNRFGGSTVTVVNTGSTPVELAANPALVVKREA